MGIILGYFIEIANFQTTPDAKASTPLPSLQPACNRVLLNALRLNGHEKKAIVKKNTICNIRAKQNCCSVVDEIKVLKFYNLYTKPKVKNHSEKILSTISQLKMFEDELHKLNISNIDFHVDHVYWRKTNESQCFSGKYFLEQANYDLLKVKRELPKRITDDFGEEFVTTFNSGQYVGLFDLKEFKIVIDTAFESDNTLYEKLLNNFGNDKLSNFTTEIGQVISQHLVNHKPTSSKLPPVEGGAPPNLYYAKLFNFTSIAQGALQKTASKFKVNFIQSKTSDIHLNELLFNIKYLLKTVCFNVPDLKKRNIDCNDLTEFVLAEILADKTLWRYLNYMLFPLSKYRYARVYSYLKNRIFKLIFDGIVKSDSLSTHSAYEIHAKIIENISTSAISGILWSGFRRIAGTVITYLATPTLINTALVCDSKQNPGDLYPTFVSFLFKATLVLEASAPMSPETDPSIVNFYKKVNDFLTEFVKKSNVGCTVKALKDNKPLTPFVKRFIKINMKRAKFAEFSGDNKKVCATVYKHNLVREAVFDERRFRYCTQLSLDFKESSASEALGDLEEIKDEMKKLRQLKKYFYCAACHSKDSTFISLTEGTINMSEQFCLDFVLKFKSYLDWKFTKLFEFQNKIFQFLSCFGKTGNLTDEYPYESFNDLIPKNFTDWTRCSKVTSVKNITDCSNLCSEIKIHTISKLIDGDRKSLKKLFNFGLNVLTQYGIQMGKFDQNYVRNFNKQIAQDMEPKPEVKKEEIKEPPKPAEEEGEGNAEGEEKKEQNNSSRRLFSGRILRERKRPVVYSLTNDHDHSDRFLQGSPPAAPPVPPADASKNASNSTSASSSNSKNATNATNATKSNLKLLETIKKNINGTLAYTSEELDQSFEIVDPETIYTSKSSVTPIHNLTVKTVRIGGLNPLKSIETRKMRFGRSISNKLVYGESGAVIENLDKEVVEACVAVDPKDVTNFAKDYRISFKKPKVVSSNIRARDADEKLFMRYKKGNDEKWEEYKIDKDTKKKKKKKGKKGRKSGSKKKPKMRNLSQKIKRSTNGNFFSNLFFKVLN
jgi:hypothetical protein